MRSSFFPYWIAAHPKRLVYSHVCPVVHCKLGGPQFEQTCIRRAVMGEATPAQSAAGPFVPMLGIGLGAMPAGVGSGPVVATARGSSVPQLHNAIVERLRARIELCRRHHSTCENRYQRGQAETSEREHESTLHLLNIVQQGTGNRKAKGSRGSNHQPPDYSRANGERKCPESEQKISTRTAVSGAIRERWCWFNEKRMEHVC